MKMEQLDSSHSKMLDMPAATTGEKCKEINGTITYCLVLFMNDDKLFENRWALTIDQFSSTKYAQCVQAVTKTTTGEN